MKKSPFSDAQIIRILDQAENGVPVPYLLRNGAEPADQIPQTVETRQAGTTGRAEAFQSDMVHGLHGRPACQWALTPHTQRAG